MPTRAVTTIVLLLLALCGTGIHDRAVASTYQVIAFLGDPVDATGIDGPFATDGAGNLYVEGYDNKQFPAGAVFELTASSAYTTARQLYLFGHVPGDPIQLNGGITLAPHKVMLGTALAGGAYGEGAVFDLGTPSAPSLTSLHAFYGGQMAPTDGDFPSGLTAGPSNRYYGTTIFGGGQSTTVDTGDGVLYSVVASLSNPHYTVLHRFGKRGDGVNPTDAQLAADAQGRLYGMTTSGGVNGLGTVFMAQEVDGAWQEQQLYSFATTGDLRKPTGNVVLDAQGNIYGCAEGGAYNRGGMFRLAPPAQPGGAWQETVLYNFGAAGNHDPIAASVSVGTVGFGGCGITLDPATNLIVGTSYGGGDTDDGTIFTLTPPVAGQTAWTETVAYSFGHKNQMGHHPVYAPLQIGSIYYGGSTGAIYAFTP